MPCVRGQAKDFMCACVRTFVTCWEVLRAADQTPAVALHLFNFFVRCLQIYSVESLRSNL